MLSNKTKNNIIKKLIPNKLSKFINKKYNINYDSDNGENEINYFNDLDIDIIGLHEDMKHINECYYIGEELLDASDPPKQIVKLIEFSINYSAIQPFLIFNMDVINNEIHFPLLDTRNEKWLHVNGKYVGYYNYENEIYVFIQTQSFKESQLFSSDKSRILCIVDDLCNIGFVYDLQINKNVQNFFFENEEFIRLIDNEGEIIDTPISGYFGSYWKRISITAALGPFSMTPHASFGPYYYFNSYNRALQFAVEDFSKGNVGKSIDLKITRDNTKILTKGGIIKFVLFLGKSKVLLNRENDPIDSSDFTNEAAKYDNFIKNTMHIRDNDGKWTKNYDSVIVTEYSNYNINNEIYNLDYQIVLKTYSQQIPLSYVYIDTSKVKETNDSQNNFNYKDAKII